MRKSLMVLLVLLVLLGLFGLFVGTTSAQNENAYCRWNAVPDAASYIYTIKFRTSPTSSWQNLEGFTNRETTELKSANFTAGVNNEYQCEVKAKPAQTTCSAGPVGTGTNTCQAPTLRPPTNLQKACPAEGSQTATFSWSSPASGPTPAAYILRLDYDNGGWFTAPDDKWICVQGTSRQVEIRDGHYNEWSVESSSKPDCQEGDWTPEREAKITRDTSGFTCIEPPVATINVYVGFDKPSVSCSEANDNAGYPNNYTAFKEDATIYLQSHVEDQNDQTAIYHGSGFVSFSVLPGDYHVSLTRVAGETPGQPDDYYKGMDGCKRRGPIHLTAGAIRNVYLFVTGHEKSGRCEFRSGCGSVNIPADTCKGGSPVLRCKHDTIGEYFCGHEDGCGVAEVTECPYPCVGKPEYSQTKNYYDFCRAENATWGPCPGNTICCCQDRNKTYDPPPPDTVPYCDTGELPPVSTPTLTPTVGGPTATPPPCPMGASCIPETQCAYGCAIARPPQGWSNCPSGRVCCHPSPCTGTCDVEVTLDDDATALPIEGATVELSKEDGTLVGRQTTNNSGTATFPDTPGSPYRIRATKQGYQELNYFPWIIDPLGDPNSCWATYSMFPAVQTGTISGEVRVVNPSNRPISFVDVTRCKVREDGTYYECGDPTPDQEISLSGGTQGIGHFSFEAISGQKYRVVIDSQLQDGTYVPSNEEFVVIAPTTGLHFTVTIPTIDLPTATPTPVSFDECEILGGGQGQCLSAGQSCPAGKTEIARCVGGGPCCAPTTTIQCLQEGGFCQVLSQNCGSGYITADNILGCPQDPQPTRCCLPVQVPPEGADLDGDGQVGSGDYFIVAAGYGQSGVGLRCDVNKDGVCNALDLSSVLSNFGQLVQ